VLPAVFSVITSKDSSQVDVKAGDIITYTLTRYLEVSGTHTYSDTLQDNVPDGLTVLVNTIRVNGAAAPGLYQPATHSLAGTILGSGDGPNWLTITYRAQVEAAFGHGALIHNNWTHWTSVTGGEPEGPFIAGHTIIYQGYHVYLPALRR
jgi:hypothetical protein